MRYLPLKYKNNSVPEILLNPGCKRKIKKAVVNENGNIFNGYYYKNKTVTDELKAFSLQKNELENNDIPKCYYCESQIDFAATLQVEHYRPKANVDKKDTKGKEHKGYYWLGCEWTNLLLACPACNGKNTKGNRFPIENIRAEPHNPINSKNELNREKCLATKIPLISEKPVLINPEIDKTEEHFTFNFNAEIIGITNRARRTIAILDLNREALKYERRKLFSKILSDIKVIFEGYGHDENRKDYMSFLIKKQCEKIIAKQEPYKKYSLWAKCFNENFEKYIDKEQIIKGSNKIILIDLHSEVTRQINKKYF